MTKKILIDARQPHETRVASINNNIIEDFEYEIHEKKQLRGNIYLARVTRVEPSLQAAFVEYGGNRQGFLAFSEIHPDYYRIPVEDREKILEDVKNKTENEESIELSSKSKKNLNDTVEDEINDDEQKEVKKNIYKNYKKIQEVISKRQILLVQIVKEERGNKGAALTTYLSIAGRYCVLMPNTPRGGGVSRKIINSSDRQRLKKVVDGLEVPKGMAVIIRTAGSKRTKVEIKRDYQNLFAIWDEVKSKTLESNAPDLIYEEGSIVKRAIRDMYNSDVEEVLVEGEKAYKTSREYMKALMPSHTKKVLQYTEKNLPLFQKFKIDTQLADIFKPTVTLKSGGYLVINHTEALVAIDVNSGKATRERSIENTALNTNLEAAEEFAKQAKLRDLSGLIVIDFIDMEEYKNRNNVERKLKDALKKDRARIQVGEISNFGLLELSRQRLRPSVSEISSDLCVHCGGVGRVQSLEVSAMQVLRGAEEFSISEGKKEIKVKTSSNVAVYILNNKIQQMKEIEERQNIKIIFSNDNNILPPDFIIEGLKDSENIPLDKKQKRGLEKVQRKNNNDLNRKNVSIATLLNGKGEDKLEKVKSKSKSKPFNKVKNNSKKTNNKNEKQQEIKTIENEKQQEIKTIENEKRKIKKNIARTKKSSTPIEIVDLNNKKAIDQPKKKGWWNN